MIKLFTHTDLDGVGCAILGKLAFGDRVEIEYCNYNDINSRVENLLESGLEKCITACHITDISVSDELAKKIDGSSDKFVLLDHHPTALELNVYDWCLVKIEDDYTNLKVSGTKLYYDYLTNCGFLKPTPTLDRFVRVVTDYDTWRWSELGENGVISKQINDLFYIYGRDGFIDWCLSEIHGCEFPCLHKADRELLKIRQKEIDDYIDSKDKSLIVKNLCGYTCGVVFAERFFSELGNKLSVRHPELDFIAMIDMNGTVSYRTVKDNIDLGKDIAKIHGGGGHSKAAGSRFSNEVAMQTLDSIFNVDRCNA